MLFSLYRNITQFFLVSVTDVLAGILSMLYIATLQLYIYCWNCSSTRRL